jgi:hypothetical protein
MLLLLDFLTKIFLKYSLFIIHVLHIIIIHETSMYIHIMYIIAHIHEGLNPKVMVMHQDVHHQTTISL